MDRAVHSYVWAPQRPRIFFMHIPKTAGMTLRGFLGNQYPVAQILPATDWISLLSFEGGELDRYRLFQGHFSCGIFDLLPPDVRPIVFLREPISRTISHLKHLRRDPDFHPAHQLAAGRSLDELVRDDRVMSLCCNIQTAQLSNDIPAETILTGLRRDWDESRVPDADPYVLDPDLAKARRALARFHFVGFVESLQQDLLQMSIAFGLHPLAMVQRSNNDPEGQTEISELDPETVAILRERNALDIALYQAARRRPRFARSAAGATLVARGLYAPISRPTEFPMSGPMPGANWYECEEKGGGQQRWTGPMNETTRDLPLAPGYRFEFFLSIAIPEIDDLGVHAGPFALPVRCQWSEGSSHHISFWVPAEAVHEGDLTSLYFRTKRVSRGSGADVRTLSFLVRELRILRVERAQRLASGPAQTGGDEDAEIGDAVIDDQTPESVIAPEADHPSFEALQPGHLLSDADLEQLHAQDARRDRQIELHREAAEEAARKLEELRRYLGEVLASIRAPVLGYAQQVGSSSGMFHDGWVTRDLSLRLRTERAITGVAIRGFIPNSFPDLSRTFDIEIDNESFSFWLHDKGTFNFLCPVGIAAGTIFDLTMRCDSEFNASAAGTGGDQRNLSYRLNAIELSHEE